MPTPLVSRLAALVLLCCAGAAHAQFVWIGPNGTRQYSDQPPPPGTPASKILKAPGRTAPAQGMPDAIPAAAAPAPVPKSPTLAEREADYRKRAKAREEQEAKAQAEARRAAARAEHCDEVRKNQRVIDSGIRIVDVGADGQRRFLGDAERAAVTRRNAQELAECR
jgi:type IV secretory pathway VirB10-like protein